MRMSFAQSCRFALVACTLILVSDASAQQTFLPVDQAASQPDFFTFRAHVQAAIARRDASALLAIVHKQIKNSFGGDDGIEEFKKKWKPEGSDSDLWKELGTALALGGSFDREGRFIAPYVYSRWPEKTDSFENLAIVGVNVRVRESPRNDSATVDSLSFVIVPLLREQKEHEGWTAIRRRNGKPGYVASQYARSPIDYRAVFARIDGRWQLTTFVAGD